MPLTVDEIVGLFERRGAAQYGGEAVSQLEHALQCSALAAEGGASAELLSAAMLHDLGHLVAERPHEVTSDEDDVHQYLALPFLRGTFPDAVLEPIRLHVDAKRYLCKVDGGYRDSLSPASQHSLALQGGVFDSVAAERFLSRPFSWDAIRLRRWDDLAKIRGRVTPSLAEIAVILRSVSAENRPVAA